MEWFDLAALFACAGAVGTFSFYLAGLQARIEKLEAVVADLEVSE